VMTRNYMGANAIACEIEIGVRRHIG